MDYINIIFVFLLSSWDNNDTFAVKDNVMNVNSQEK